MNKNDSIQTLQRLITQGQKAHSTHQFASIGTALAMLILTTPDLLKDPHVTNKMKAQALSLIVHSTDKEVVANRKKLIDLLSFKNFAAFKVNHRSCPNALITAVNQQNRLLFKDLLSHRLAMDTDCVKNFTNIFYPDSGNLMMWDLFPEILDPEHYQNTAFKNLTPYEKLYFILHEQYASLELSHRLNLTGMVDIQWDKYKFRDISLEGQNAGFSLLQLKNHLLNFSNKHHDKLSPGFQQAIERMLDLVPQSGIHLLNQDTTTPDNVFLMNHVNHGWCALLTDDKLYMVNMGLGSSPKPGIEVFAVPRNKRNAVLTALKELEKTDMLDNLSVEEEETVQTFIKKQDFDGLLKFHVDRMHNRMKFDHYREFAKNHKLKKVEHIDIPSQPGGHCSYYSPKGLLLALAYHYNQAKNPAQKAFKMSLNDFMAFVNNDYDNALDDYLATSLNPNPKLLHLAQNQLKQYHQIVSLQNSKEPTLDSTNYRLERLNKKRPS